MPVGRVVGKPGADVRLNAIARAKHAETSTAKACTGKRSIDCSILLFLLDCFVILFVVRRARQVPTAVLQIFRTEIKPLPESIGESSANFQELCSLH